MDQDRIIAEVARKNGVLLHSDDPILQINTMLDMHEADHREREERLAQRDTDLLARMDKLAAEIKALTEAVRPSPVALTDKQVNIMAQRLLTGCEAWSIRLVKQQFWRMSVAIVAGGLVCAGIGAATLWFLMPQQPAMMYQDQPDGSRIGYYFVRPPAPKPAAPEATQAAPAPTPTKQTTATARKS